MRATGIFLIAVALIAGMVGCGGGDGNGHGDGESYTLSIDSTAGGTVTVDNVAIPGKAMLTYDAGTAVDLIATPSLLTTDLSGGPVTSMRLPISTRPQPLSPCKGATKSPLTLRQSRIPPTS
jgi:hypothetical protein